MSRFNNVFKKVGLIALGVGAIGIVGLGIKSTVNYFKNDTKTLHLNYEVGNLGTDGKYVNDELALYSNKFACEGLRVSFDFDAEVNGQFAFYDINDKYLSKTDVITEGTSVDIPLNGAYARAVVIPTNDEDEKISFTEKYKYGSQMQVKVNKKAEANIKNKFVVYKGTNYEVVNTIADAVFVKGYAINGDGILNKQSSDKFAATTQTLINIQGYKSLKYTSSKLGTGAIYNNLFIFSELPESTSTFKVVENAIDYTFEKNDKYILISLYNNESNFDAEVAFNSAFQLLK